MISQKHSKIQYLQEFIATYYACTWQLQRIVFARRQSNEIIQYSSSPNHRFWRRAVQRAEYMCPSTFHQFYVPSRKTQVMRTEEVDTIPFIFVDVDYPEAPENAAGDVICAGYDLGIPPTLVVTTPHGAHAYWALQEPLRVRWEKAIGTGIWRPKKEAVQAQKWWRNVSYALCHALASVGIPADPAAAGQVARLMRVPTPDNVIWEAPQYRYDLQDFSDRLEEYMSSVRYYRGVGREFTTFGPVSQVPGVEEGERNSTCWKLCIAALHQTQGDENAAWRMIREWAARCTPPYPEKETYQTFRSIAKGYKQGRYYVVRQPVHIMTRKAAATKAYQTKHLRTLEKVHEAIERLSAQGIPPKENLSLLAREAKVDRKTLRRLIKVGKLTIL